MQERWSSRDSHAQLNRKLDEVLKRLDHLHELSHRQNEGIIKMSGEVDSIVSVVTEISGRVDSAVETMEQLAGLIVDNINDKPKLLQIAADLKAKSDKLASAIEANDPDSAPPAPPVEPAA